MHSKKWLGTNMNQCFVVVFAREPQEGRVKTRLAESIGAQKACHIYETLLTHTLDVLNCTDHELIVYLTDESNRCFLQDSKYPDNLSIRQQSLGDLGNKMRTMFEELFAEGAGKIVLVGSDCPWLSSKHINQAFYYLTNNDVVLGPADDGGYYLIGLSKKCLDLFSGVEWSTAKVLEQTKALILQHHLSYRELETLSDVDYIEDIRRYFNNVKSVPQTLRPIALIEGLNI